jgi:short-subunit dehydrogenase
MLSNQICFGPICTILVLAILVIYVIGPIIWLLAKIIYKSGVPERDLAQRYGPGSWCVVTGASRGQGRVLATGMAKRGFNLILIGSARTHDTAKQIQQQYPSCQIWVVERDFAQALSDPEWWQEIEDIFRGGKYDISVIINNVGQRTASRPSHQQSDRDIRASLITGTYPQIRLTNIALEHMTRRQKMQALKPAGEPRYRSCIIFNTAQCQHPLVGLSTYLPSGEISVPYLSVYEAANAFGYYHANSIIAELSQPESNLSGEIDLLNITPGAVVTENTPYLKDTPFAVPVDQFCAGIFRLMGGNWRGATCAYWGHDLSGILIGIAPWFRAGILKTVGKTISGELSKT